MLAATLGRLKSDAGFAAPILLCNNDHRFLVKEEIEQARIEPKVIILEPIARNTAAAIAVAALFACRENPNTILAVMPSDHVVRDETRFVDGVKRAAEVAATGKLVLFGIKPTEPHTGYGYIRQGENSRVSIMAPSPSTLSSKSRTLSLPSGISTMADIFGTAESSSYTPAHSWTNWQRCSPEYSWLHVAR